MIGNISTGSDFRGLVDYLLNSSKAPQIVDTNLAGGDRNTMTWELDICANQRPSTKKPVKHISVGFAPDDGKLDRETIEDIAIAIIDGLGYDNNQYLVVRHGRVDPKHDRVHEHDHFHILINMVNFEGKRIVDSYDKKKLENILRQQEIEHNLTVVASSEQRRYKASTTGQTQRMMREVEEYRTGSKTENLVVPYAIKIQSGIDLASRDRLFAIAQPQRHHVILDLNARSSLLTWEALRQVPEGGVYACVRNQTEAEILNQQAAMMPELLRPQVLVANLPDLPSILEQQHQDLRFDKIVGRNALMSETDKVSIISQLIPWLNKTGSLILAETVPIHNQRVYNLLQPNWLPSKLWSKLKLAEEAIYQNEKDPMVNWDGTSLKQNLSEAGLEVKLEQEPSMTSMLITLKLIRYWFAENETDLVRSSYRSHLKKILSDYEIDCVRTVFEQKLCRQTVDWSSTVAYFTIKMNSKI